MKTLGMEEQAKYDELQKTRDEMFNKALPFFESSHELDRDDIGAMAALKEIYALSNEFDKVEKMKENILKAQARKKDDMKK